MIKICGTTSEEDALLAVAMDADAVGFVFAPSPRQEQGRYVGWMRNTGYYGRACADDQVQPPAFVPKDDKTRRGAVTGGGFSWMRKNPLDELPTRSWAENEKPSPVPFGSNS